MPFIENFFCAFISFNWHNHRSIISSTLQMRKLRTQEIKSLAQSKTDSKRQNQELNPHLIGFKSQLSPSPANKASSYVSPGSEGSCRGFQLESFQDINQEEKSAPQLRTNQFRW